MCQTAGMRQGRWKKNVFAGERGGIFQLEEGRFLEGVEKVVHEGKALNLAKCFVWIFFSVDFHRRFLSSQLP